MLRDNTSPPCGLKVGGNAIVATLLLWLAGLLCAAAPSQAVAGDRVDFDIAAQSADKGLIEFVRQAGLSVLLPTERINQFATHEVRGSYEVEQALAMLLSGSGLSGELSMDGVMIIRMNQSGGGAMEYSSKERGSSAAAPAQSRQGFSVSRIIAFLGSAIAGTATVPAHAQSSDGAVGTLEEIIVTAERRSENIQKAATSVSVRSGEDLITQGKYSLGSILEDVPGMAGGAALSTLVAAGSGTDNPAAGLVIRGIPSNSGVSSGITSVASAAAIYVDGVYEGLGGGYDIERVEALRGPQGTLYGRSATTGLVAIHTRNPQLGEFGGNVSLEAGNYDLRHFSGGVNVPVGDTLALRFAGNKYERDGFLAEHGGDDPFGQSSEATDGRMKLLFAPSDAFSVLLAAAAQNNTTYTGGTTVYLTSPDSHYSVTPNSAGPSPGSNRYRQYWAEINWDIGFAHFTYQPAFRSWTSTNSQYSRSALGWFDLYSATPKDDFWTHEVHLSSKPDSKLVWQVGTLYYDNKLENSSLQIRRPSNAFFQNADIQRRTRALGTFAEATYPFADSWRATAGVRYDSTKVQVNEVFTTNTNCSGSATSATYCLPEVLATGILSGDAGKRTYNNWTYKLRLEHDLTPDNLVYAMVSTGVSPGDVTMTVNSANQPTPKDITAETLTSYEIGSKNRFLDDALQINGSAYYYDYGAYQVANVNVNGTIVNGYFVAAQPFRYEVLSAPVTAYGLELEAVYQLTPNDRVGLSYSYNEAYFTDKDQRVAGTNATFGDFFGYDRIPGVAPHTAALSYDHTFHLFVGSTLTLHAATRWLSSRVLTRVSKAQLSNATVAAAIQPWIETEAEYVSDLNATWTSRGGMYSVTAWMRNVFDNRYKTYVSATNIANVNANNLATAFNTIAATPYDPRTYGVVVSVKW